MENDIQQPEQAAKTETAELKKTSLGLEENVESLLCYLFGWVTGLIFLLIEKDNKTVKFHAVQSLALSIVVTAAFIVIDFILSPILWVLFLLWGLLGAVLGVGYVVLSIYMMVKTYQGNKILLPVVGPFAEKTAAK